MFSNSDGSDNKFQSILFLVTALNELFFVFSSPSINPDRIFVSAVSYSNISNLIDDTNMPVEVYNN